MEERFYLCNTCGNLMIAAIASGVVPYCCGEKMTLLKPNTSDGNTEKHVPVVSIKSDHTLSVKVGSKAHPMTAEHNIRFICLVTDIEVVIRYLNENDPPEACIQFNGKPKAVYAYCNIHGLWRADVKEEDKDCSKWACQRM